jgi:hypothetical protein
MDISIKHILIRLQQLVMCIVDPRFGYSMLTWWLSGHLFRSCFSCGHGIIWTSRRNARSMQGLEFLTIPLCRKCLRVMREKRSVTMTFGQREFDWRFCHRKRAGVT